MSSVTATITSATLERGSHRVHRLTFALLAVGIAIALFFAMLAFLEVGRQLGIREFARHGAAARSGVGVADGAVFALLAFLIGFAFSGAASRFESRRSLVAEAVNSLGTAWQRIDVLPAEHQEPIRVAFRRYMDALLAYYAQRRGALATLQEPPALTRAQNEVWTKAVAACVVPSGDQARMLLLPALNEMFGMVEKERLARRMHTPFVIFVMLGITALAAAVFAGYGMASGATRNWVYIVGIAGTIATATYVIIDLEFPRLGLIRIDGIDSALVELRGTMK
jgi:hypothetical protein